MAALLNIDSIDNIENIKIEKQNDDEISQGMIEDAATRFSNHYGVWGPLAPAHMGSFAQPGKRIRMSSRRLRQECVPAAAQNTMVRVFVLGECVGHACASRWPFEGRPICWITQLCVHRDYRRRGLATKLLEAVRDGDDYAYGILSSHPAAILGFSRALVCDREHPIQPDERQNFMAVSPVAYVRLAKHQGDVSCADTGFFVDHAEPMETIASLRAEGRKWVHGHLPEGHEFLAMARATTT